MKRLITSAIAVLVGLAITTSVNAQIKIKVKKIQIKPGKIKKIQIKPGQVIIGQGRQNAFPINLVNSPDVQKDLGLSEKQVADVKKIVADQQTGIKSLRQDLQQKKIKANDYRTKVQELQKNTQTAVTKLIGEKGTKRLKEIQMQVRGPFGFAKQLEITKQQQQQVQQIRKSINKERQNIIKNNQGNIQAIRDGLAKIQQKIKEKSLEVLTDDQKATWEKMTGKPFKGKVTGRVGIGVIRPGVIPIQPPNIKIRPLPLKKLRPKKLQLKKVPAGK